MKFNKQKPPEITASSHTRSLLHTTSEKGHSSRLVAGLLRWLRSRRGFSGTLGLLPLKPTLQGVDCKSGWGPGGWRQDRDAFPPPLKKICFRIWRGGSGSVCYSCQGVGFCSKNLNGGSKLSLTPVPSLLLASWAW